MIGLLAVMTAVEFAIAVMAKDSLLLALLLIIALAKGWLIIQYFMHFGQLWEHVSDAWYGMLNDDPAADSDED